MKKVIFLFILFISFGMSAQAQQEPAAGKEIKINMMEKKHGPIMTFADDTVDYGTIEQHGEPLRTLKFTNTGTEPLVIKNARGSCGCTVPSWTKEPIMPGESSEIEIRYATNRLGKINKKVTITTNEGGAPHVIKVIGNILKKEEEEVAPAKAPSILNGGK